MYTRYAIYSFNLDYFSLLVVTDIERLYFNVSFFVIRVISVSDPDLDPGGQKWRHRDRLNVVFDPQKIKFFFKVEIF